MASLDRRALGDYGETLAAKFLEEKGYRICARQFRVMGGELDLVAQCGRDLVFVEVKTRTGEGYGYPEDAVTARKVLRMRHAARAYLNSTAFYGVVRFDIVAITLDVIRKKAHIHHIKDIAAV